MADIIDTIVGNTTGNNTVDTTGLNNTNIETNVNNGSIEQNNSSQESNSNESVEQYKKDLEEQYKAKYEAEYKEKELMLGMTEAEKMACDMVLFDYYCVENGIEEVRTTQIPGGKVISLEKEHQLLLAPPAAWAKLFNREFYVKADCPFPKGLYFEDLATTPIFFLKAERISYLKEPLYYYIIRENSIMTGKNHEKSSHDKMEVLDHILSVYRENGKYETYREELEYLVLANAYFEPSKELVLEGEDGTYLQKYRDYAKSRIGNVKNNKYINQWSRKDKLHLWILNYKQYWLMRLLSKARRMVSTKM